MADDADSPFRARKWPRDLGLPDRDKRLPNAAADLTRMQAREAFSRNPPAQPQENQYALAANFKDNVWLCVRALMDAMGSATIRVSQRKDLRGRQSSAYVRKAVPTAGQQSDDYELEPADPDHPLCQLLRRPNRAEPLCDFLSYWTLQDELIGESFVWHPCTANAGGSDEYPEEMWVIPAPLCQRLPMSPMYPLGAVRTTNLNPGAMGAPRWGGLEIDGRDLLHVLDPHPLWRWVAYSRQTAGARSLDVLGAINEAWKNHMDHGFSANTVVTVPGASQDTVDEAVTRLRNTYAGSRGHRIVGFGGGSEDMDVKSVEQVGARDMDYGSGYDRLTKFASAIWGTSDSMLGLSDEDNYASLWAKIKRDQVKVLAPRTRRRGAHLTMHLADRFWPQDRLVVELDLPRIEDEENERAWAALKPGPLLMFNEFRKLRNLPPVPDGDDVLASVYEQVQLQNLAPQPAAPGQGPPGGASGLPEPGEGHPLDALGDAALEALGVQGADAAPQQPGPQPSANGAHGPGSRHGRDGRFVAGKAFAPGRYDESKHKRDHGKFSSTGGAGSAPGGGRGSGPGGSGLPPGAVPPAAANHPKARAAIQRLTQRAGEVAQRVNAKMLEHGIGPDELVGTFDDWARILSTKHADVVGHACGLDAMTAAHLLTHVLTHAWQRVKAHLTKGAPPPASEANGPSAAPQGRQDGSDGGPPRPDNPQGKGSLPNRVSKAWAAADLEAVLDDILGATT